MNSLFYQKSEISINNKSSMHSQILKIINRHLIGWISFIITFFICAGLNCQEITKTFSLTDVIQLAQEQSIDAMLAKQAFEQSYLEYSAYKAEFLPSLSLNTNLVNYSRTVKRDYNPSDSVYEYYEENANTSNMNLQILQNITFSGGSISLNGDLNRYDYFDKKTKSYSSYPNISINQPIQGYNEFKWNRKIQPKKYENAKMTFVQTMENIASKAIDLFFDLCANQVSMTVAKFNYQNADTLYKISQGRYEMGKISENDLLQMELNYLNTKTSLNSTRFNLDQAKYRLKQYLGFNEKVNIELVVPDSVPQLAIDLSKALNEAEQNNPDVQNLDIRILEADKSVALARSDKGITGSLNLSYGLSRIDDRFPDIITDKNNISNNQNIMLGLQIPLIDWGQKKGQYKLAKINQEIVNLQVKQALIDFEQSVTQKVVLFNMQDEQYQIAKKSEYVASKNYEVTKQRFLIGKVDVLELNTSQKAKDAEKLNYINAIRAYWKSFYDLRITTLYDFAKNESILKQYNDGVKNEFLNR